MTSLGVTALLQCVCQHNIASVSFSSLFFRPSVCLDRSAPEPFHLILTFAVWVKFKIVLSVCLSFCQSVYYRKSGLLHTQLLTHWSVYLVDACSYVCIDWPTPSLCLSVCQCTCPPNCTRTLFSCFIPTTLERRWMWADYAAIPFSFVTSWDANVLTLNRVIHTTGLLHFNTKVFKMVWRPAFCVGSSGLRATAFLCRFQYEQSRDQSSHQQPVPVLL